MKWHSLARQVPVAAALVILSGLPLSSGPGLAGQPGQPDRPDRPADIGTWNSRVYFDGFWETDSKARAAAETIQPLFMSLQHTGFVQARAGYDNSDWTFNAGLGWRYMLTDRTLLLGVNAWHDWTVEHEHRRWGLGAEAIGEVMTLRANYYGAYTGWRTIEDTATYRIEERAMKGLDAEIETQLPYIPWARVSAGWYHWDATADDDVDGFKSRLKLDLTPYTRLETGISADKTDTTGFLKLSFALGAPRDVKHTLTTTGLASSQVVDKRDLKAMRLTRVERNHTVAVERRTLNKATGSFSGGVVFARGS